MCFYAQLDSNNICVGLSRLGGEVTQDNLIRIEAFDADLYWRKYENGQWSVDKFEPASTAPLDDFEQTKQRVDLLEDAVNSLVLGV